VRRFTSASDVWSFGITVHEIFSGAEKPYRAMTNKEVWLNVKQGYRLPRPQDCPDNIYQDIVRPCWAARAGNRPTFEALVRLIDTELRKARGSARPVSAVSAVGRDVSFVSQLSATMEEPPLTAWWDGQLSDEAANTSRMSNETDIDLHADETFLRLMDLELQRNFRPPSGESATDDCSSPHICFVLHPPIRV